MKALGLLAVIAALALGPLGDAASAADRYKTSIEINPQQFSELASGIVLIRGFSCSGAAKITGTGFLVGASVVMTARHVVDPEGAEARLACRIRVRVDGHWVSATKTAWWYRSKDPTGRSTDLATLKLAAPASSNDHIFDFRDSSPPPGMNLSMLGHPLGNDISLTQGRLVAKRHVSGVPVLLIDLLGAEGASGAPIVDGGGHVVGILQLGLGGKDILGQRTAGVIVGIDLASWWGSGRRVEMTLCRAYPLGGIVGCPGSRPAQAPPKPAPPVRQPPATPVPPAAPAWVVPTGFKRWVGEGTFIPGTIAWQFADCTRIYPTSASCWGVNVISDVGCPQGAYIKVEIDDSSGAVIDHGIDGIVPLPADEVDLAHGDTFYPDAASFRVTEISCFNY